MLATHGNIEIIDSDLEQFFAIHGRYKRGLIILDQLSLEDVLPFVSRVFDECKIIDARAGIASFTRKLAPEINYLSSVKQSAFDLFFPFDERGFLKALQGAGNTVLMLNHQEVTENIYTLGVEEELAIVDTQFLFPEDGISLINCDHPDYMIVGMGNLLEILVQLSQLLDQEKVSLWAFEQWNSIFSQKMHERLPAAKQLIVIIDHALTSDLISFFSAYKQPVHFLVPEYGALTSRASEYQFEQACFDAYTLLERIKKL